MTESRLEAERGRHKTQQHQIQLLLDQLHSERLREVNTTDRRVNREPIVIPAVAGAVPGNTPVGDTTGSPVVTNSRGASPASSSRAHENIRSPAEQQLNQPLLDSVHVMAGSEPVVVASSERSGSGSRSQLRGDGSPTNRDQLTRHGSPEESSLPESHAAQEGNHGEP